jgi:hypothetical protein
LASVVVDRAKALAGAAIPTKEIDDRQYCGIEAFGVVSARHRRPPVRDGFRRRRPWVLETSCLLSVLASAVASAVAQPVAAAAVVRAAVPTQR